MLIRSKLYTKQLEKLVFQGPMCKTMASNGKKASKNNY